MQLHLLGKVGDTLTVGWRLWPESWQRIGAILKGSHRLNLPQPSGLVRRGACGHSRGIEFDRVVLKRPLGERMSLCSRGGGRKRWDVSLYSRRLVDAEVAFDLVFNIQLNS